MSSGKWLTPDKRAAIIDGNAAGLSHRAIARQAEVSPSAVYREVAAYARECRRKEKRAGRAVEMAGELARAAVALQLEVEQSATS